jgi:ABC-type sugar transport system ATPase subunit
MAQIEVQNVTKYYDNKKVLDNVTFTVEDKSITCILGPPNAGKTTLLRVIAGLEKHDSGVIKIDGKVANNLRPIDRKVAMVFQNFALYPHMTVFDNIASPLRIMKRSQEEIVKRVKDVTELLKINYLLNRRPAELSGGERQRVAIARALVRDDVEIFLLDEPLTNLDYKIREEMRAKLRNTFMRRGGTIIIASPDPLDAFAIAHHVVVMNMGRVIQTGRVREVYDNPRNTLVAKILSRPQINLIEAVIERHEGKKLFLSVSNNFSIDVTRYEEKLRNENEYLIGIRPHEIFFVSSEQIPKDCVTLAASVIITEIEGSESIIHVDWDGKRIVIYCPYIKRLTPGEKIQIGFRLGDVYIYSKRTGDLITKYT